MPELNSATRKDMLSAFDRLLTIMDELRANCPWDKKQTIQSLRYLTIEETYELSEAIVEGNMEDIKKELGDLMLHIVFYSKIASEQSAFNITDVIHTLCEKLIARHPHIYGDIKAENEEQVKQNWEQLKLKEQGGNKTILSGVPSSLPALTKAIRIQEKARSAGFDWEKKEQVWEKVKEEMAEFEATHGDEANGENLTKAEEEFGDLLFSLINYARFININPEDALEKTNKKFIKRFTYLEEQSKKDGKNLHEMSLEEMDEYWNKAKLL
ncbi:MAG: nucleoside triphosphate pyrophosphohydrolase [Cytophagaceae bacterium]|nr:nucleoside triphosphate pyrophosphohydrolase [Cytophagaceae bacterium]MDW8456303.1 nucleoside triphosphate pyrophosphohydrolase [Cytophagaceae bacterium]